MVPSTVEWLSCLSHRLTVVEYARISRLETILDFTSRHAVLYECASASPCRDSAHHYKGLSKLISNTGDQCYRCGERGTKIR